MLELTPHELRLALWQGHALNKAYGLAPPQASVAHSLRAKLEAELQAQPATSPQDLEAMGPEAQATMDAHATTPKHQTHLPQEL